MRFTALSAPFVLLALGTGACGNADQPSGPDPSTGVVSVLGVKVVPQAVQLAVGETRQLVVTVAPVNATDRAITWESADSSVASISADGIVTAKAAGSGVFITVVTHDGHHEASANVSVIP